MYTGLLLFLVLAIVVSFLCSLWESVLLSITPAYAQLEQEQNTSLGKRLGVFKRNIDRPLAAILTLNTIAHTVGAIGVGEQATKIWHETHPFITGFVVPVGMTLAILILSEIIPKTLGANYWKEFARFTVNSLSTLILVLWPAVWLSEKITRVLRKDKEGSVFSRSEFMALAEIGVKQGVIAEKESHIIRSLLHFRGIQAKDVMTPRVVVKSASQELTIAEYLKDYKNVRFSRIPVYEDKHHEKITGYVRREELLVLGIENKTDQALASVKREMMAVLQNFPIPELFNVFLEKREHIALVVDEFGGMCGIVTMEDIIETLLGLEIVDEFDNVEDMQKLARAQWEKRALALGLVKEPDLEE